MNNKKFAAMLPPLTSLALGAASGVGLTVLYGITKYLPFYLLGLTLFLPSAVYVSLFILKIPTVKGKRPTSVAPDNVGKFKKVLRAIAKPFVFIGRHISGKLLRCISYVTAAAAFVILQYFFAISLKASTSLYKVNYAIAVALIVLFLLFIVLDKWMLHTDGTDEYAQALTCNVRSLIAVARLALIVIIPAIFIKLLGLYELQKYVVIALAVLFYWCSLFTLLSYIARAVRQELESAPDIRIPTLFSGGSGKDMGIISYLEDNTGITMRGLWSVKLIKKLTLPSLVAVFLLFWISTGFVEVGSGQHAALYNFGRLAPEPLEPGIHLTLPWPFAKTVIYDTDAVSTMTIGYRSNTAADNVWTQTHGSEEYELLLGGGEELVSINLCLEYKIKDLNEYLLNCANPEAILEASAYELVAEKTIVTDLDTLLSVDREAFAADFLVELTQKLGAHNTGLEVVSVVLESIHPPLGIADIYQQLVSAEIEAKTIIMKAEATAAVRILEAETVRNSNISVATAERLNKIAAAQAEVAEFMASVSADNSYSDAYRYYKYLNAVKNAYGNANLIIVGSDVDQNRIYFGSFNK
ncbi:MAG: SPFH domain-containing protein [Eubacteriales bacterium]